MMKKFYALFATLIIAGYGYAGFRGVELRPTKKGYAPRGQSIGRGTQGGSRAFWYGGYRGGK
jgi:hypothetical protein